MEPKHCEYAKITSEVSDDGYTVFIRLVFDRPLCCTDHFKAHLLRFMHQIDFKYVARNPEEPLQ